MDIYFIRDHHSENRIAAALRNHTFVNNQYAVLLELVNDYPLKCDFESLAAQVCEEKENATDKTALSTFIQNCNKVFCFDTSKYDKKPEPCLKRHNDQFSNIQTALGIISPAMPVIVIVGEAHLNDGEIEGWVSHKKKLSAEHRTYFRP